jgi:electron transfer flavoprotein alpha subunit
MSSVMVEHIAPPAQATYWFISGRVLFSIIPLLGQELVLVSIGRGIQESEHVALAKELADAIGAAVSCSRPVVDAKWMEKSRQVGSSGKIVKPKVYVACGISGSFQHLAGLKGNPFIVAINKNPKTQMFRVADVGIVADLLEFLPAATTRILGK